jgi:hypothetical protein
MMSPVGIVFCKLLQGEPLIKHSKNFFSVRRGHLISMNRHPYKGAFTPNVKSVLSENLGGILGGTQR